jgi:hypothetical protein
MSRITTFTLAIAASLFTTVSQADSPLPPPSKFTAKSPDGLISAISDPVANTIKITKTSDGKLLWEIPHWERWPFVANDGKHVVVGYNGMNLVPVRYDEKLVVFTFWREGKKIREVTIKEFLAGKSPPRKTASHYRWGWIEKIDSDGLLVVHDSNHQKRYRYNLDTGLEVK